MARSQKGFKPLAGLAMLDTVTEKKMAELSGYSVEALKKKRQRGTLPKDKVWWKDDGEIVYSLEGYEQWRSKSRANISASPSSIRASESALSGPSQRQKPHCAQPSVYHIGSNEI